MSNIILEAKHLVKSYHQRSGKFGFGSTQVKAARQRKSAIEEENKRTENSGGMGGS